MRTNTQFAYNFPYKLAFFAGELSLRLPSGEKITSKLKYAT